MGKVKASRTPRPQLAKCPTGIIGLDDITGGGLPLGRPTLVCGGAGSGKTLISMEFVIHGIMKFNEPGAIMSFEETSEELSKNVRSLGFDVDELIRKKKLAIDYVRVERSEIEETGEYDLEGLFIRLDAMIRTVRAKRVVLDTIEALFAGIPNEAILRAELRRLFRWLKDRGVTAVITGEQGERFLTRYGLEEYVSDCVIFLDHRVSNQIATRRLRIVKYRGSSHGTNEYPMLIDENGISVLPISTLGLSYAVSNQRVSSGIRRLDTMLGGKGYYRGSSILISGMAGTGKTSMAMAFLDATCRRGERAMCFSFEESPKQIIRNMGSIGFDLGKWTRKGLLRINSFRPQLYGLEMHLMHLHRLVFDFKPSAVVMDPVTNLSSIGDTDEIKAMLTRLIDYLKTTGITSVYTSLSSGSSASVMEWSEVGISSLMDTWLLLRMIESDSERNRLLYILKSRGMEHSNQMREFQLTGTGIRLVDVYVGPGMVLTGAARLAQEAGDRERQATECQTSARRIHELNQEQVNLQEQAGIIAQRLDGIAGELAKAKQNGIDRKKAEVRERQEQSRARKAD